MSRDRSLGWKIDTYVADRLDSPVPAERTRPRWLAPLPEWLENVAFRLVWLLVAVNLAGTAFGFWYYIPQLSETPSVMWPIVPVSPLGTLYFALSLSCWRLGYDGRLVQLLHVLAFVGCLKYGLWTVFVQLFVEDASVLHVAVWQFLIWSHVGMAVQAFLVTRYAEFPLWAVGTATGWYVLNDSLDYFVTALGGPHHTWLNVTFTNGELVRPSPAFELMAVSAVTATAIGVTLALTAWRSCKRPGP